MTFAGKFFECKERARRLFCRPPGIYSPEVEVDLNVVRLLAAATAVPGPQVPGRVLLRVDGLEQHPHGLGAHVGEGEATVAALAELRRGLTIKGEKI